MRPHRIPETMKITCRGGRSLAARDSGPEYSLRRFRTGLSSEETSQQIGQHQRPDIRMQPYPQSRILVELAGPRFWLVGNLSFHHPAVADLFGRSRIGIHDRLNDPVGAKDDGRTDSQDVAGASAFCFVPGPRLDTARLKFGQVMLEYVR